VRRDVRDDFRRGRSGLLWSRPEWFITKDDDLFVCEMGTEESIM
jgi:hypothetical protein